MMTERQQNIFFALIRRALWQRQYDSTLQQSDTQLLSTLAPMEDWKPILKACDDHRILSVVIRGIKTMPLNLQPSDNQFSAIDNYIFKQWQQRNDMHKAIHKVFGAIEAAGAKPVLLKGEGLAALYPENTVRAIGDIDVYVGEDDFVKSCMAVDELNGDKPDVSRYYHDSEHHYETACCGVPVEIHRCIADDEEERYAAQMNQWAVGAMNITDCRTVTILGKEILLPPVAFDMFYVFQHLAKHVLRDGGGLRQMMDWALYLRHVSDKQLTYDKEALYDALVRFDHLRPWQILAGVLHHQLGLSPDEIPFYDEKKAAMSQGACLNDMVYEGNLGWAALESANDNSSNPIKRAFMVFYAKVADYRKRRMLFPKSSRKKLRHGIMISLKLHFPKLFGRLEQLP